MTYVVFLGLVMDLFESGKVIGIENRMIVPSPTLAPETSSAVTTNPASCTLA